MEHPKKINIRHLVERISTLTKSGHQDRVTSLLQKLQVQPESLKSFLYFHPDHYSRNLIFKNKFVEILVLCWMPGQRSWIHNHHGQHCWMMMAEGTLAVRNYRRIMCNTQTRRVDLKLTQEYVLTTGGAEMVNPEEPLHMVWNPPELNQQAISIHIYSHPFDTCTVFDTNTGTCKDLKLSYTTAFGKTIPAEKFHERPFTPCTLTAKERCLHCGGGE
ncbi:MAG: cysteine dioxygenase family protein [Nitrososphaerota archaeon]